MLDPNREVDELGARLSEIDRKLGELQAELLLPGDVRGAMTEGAIDPAHARAPAAEELTVSAGPFHSVEEVRAFERELARLPGVRAAVLRGYEGSDRVVIDVQLER